MQNILSVFQLGKNWLLDMISTGKFRRKTDQRLDESMV